LTEDFLRKRCREILREKIADVTIFDESQEKRIPLFEPNEIKFGKILGKGGFCTVTKLDRINEAQNDPNRRRQQSQDENEFFTITQSREFICNNFIRNGEHRYAIKKLTSTLYDDGDPQHFVCGVIDLAMEVKFLSILRHPHIIKMRAMANVDYCSADFFILLDKLNMTLGQQISVWKKEMPSGFGASVKRKKEEFFGERLMVAHDICTALQHLHERRIVYRDLKPDNIGFDVRGDVKVFDFGRAREMIDDKKVSGTDTYLLTKDTGSPRYMAPEVFIGVPYNEKCDVYSFGLILWQCLELTPPFNNYDLKKMASRVYNGKEYPKLNSKWNSTIKDLFTNLFLRRFSKRYDCDRIIAILRGEIGEIDGDMIGELDISNRTEMSIKNLRI
jgi:serine/threonine protein kinase